MTNIFTDTQRHDPAEPVALTPRAAGEGGPDSAGGGVGVDFFLQLGATLGTLAEQMQTDRDEREHRNLPPSNEVLFKAATFPAAGNLIFDLGSVPLGRVWQVRRLNVGGVAANTTATGTGYVFKQGAAPNDLNLTNCINIFPTLPAIQPYGTHQFFCIATEHVYVVVAGGTAGQQYTATAIVEDWHYGAFTRSYSAE